MLWETGVLASVAGTTSRLIFSEQFSWQRKPAHASNTVAVYIIHLMVSICFIEYNLPRLSFLSFAILILRYSHTQHSHHCAKYCPLSSPSHLPFTNTTMVTRKLPRTQQVHDIAKLQDYLWALISSTESESVLASVAPYRDPLLLVLLNQSPSPSWTCTCLVYLWS